MVTYVALYMVTKDLYTCKILVLSEKKVLWVMDGEQRSHVLGYNERKRDEVP